MAQQGRVSKSQPQGPAFTSGKPKAPDSQPTPQPTYPNIHKASQPAKVNSKGQVTRCPVILKSGVQCSNPARWEQTGWTCTTHRLSIQGGRTYSKRAKAQSLYVSPSAKAKAQEAPKA